MNADIDWEGLLHPPEPEPPADTLLRRLANADDLLTFAAGLTAVAAVAGSIQTADWVESMPFLPAVAALGLLVGFVLSRVAASAARRAWMALGGALVAGALVVIPITLTAIDSGDPWTRWNAFRDRMAAWWDVVVNGGISDDQIPFILLMVSLTWIVSYIVAWSLFSLRNAWAALIPLGAVVVINTAYQPIRFDWAFAIFLFAGLLLVGRGALHRQMNEWTADDADVPEFYGLAAFWRSFWVVSLLLLTAWLIPANTGGQFFGGAWDTVREPLDNKLFESSRFFAAVRGHGDASFRDFGYTLPLGASIDLRNRVLMRVALSEPVPFLRVASYQQYDRSGWLNTDLRKGSESGVGIPAPADLAPLNDADLAEDGGLVVAEIEVRRKLGRLGVPGAPLAFDRDLKTESPPPVTYALPLTKGGAAPAGTPADLAALLQQLQQAYPKVAVADRYDSLLPLGYAARALKSAPPTLFVEREPSLADAISLDPGDSLERGDRYRVVGEIENAPASELRAAGTDYPLGLQPFLQLPDEFPGSVRDLALKLTAGSETPYDKALAIEQYVRAIEYDETIPRAQPGVDRVERFLFGTRRGYFDYHASAMTVMLRVAGVPARLASGYVLEEVGGDGRFTVRERHTYSWPEVYFPGIGWVAFNPSPDRPLVARPKAPGEEELLSPVDGGLQLGPPELDLGVTDSSGGADAGELGAGGGWSAAFIWWLAAVVAAVALGVAAGRFIWERSVAGLPYPAKLWAKVQRLAVAARLGPKDQQTPREFGRELSESIEGTEAIERLARAYERSRFGGHDPDKAEREILSDDYRSVRNRLLGRALGWRGARNGGGENEDRWYATR